MALRQHQRACGVFSNVQDAQGALEELKASDFPMSQVSVINRHVESTGAKPGTKAQDATNIGAIAGGTVGGVLGLTVGLGTLAAIPGIGPIMLIGAAATALATTVTSGVIGATAGGLMGAMVGYGIPEDQAGYYERSIQRGDYFVILDGTEAEVRVAEAICSRWNIQGMRIYNVATQ